MRIEDLKPAAGSKKRNRRIGRGPGSGRGKTSTRGHTGQMSRTGKGITPGFEGGQMPLIRRLPKRGFNKRPRKGHHSINLKVIASLNKEESVTPELLKEKGFIKGPLNYVKILGQGELKAPVTVKAHAFSKSAADKIKGAGGKCEYIKQSVSGSRPSAGKKEADS